MAGQAGATGRQARTQILQLELTALQGRTLVG